MGEVNFASNFMGKELLVQHGQSNRLNALRKVHLIHYSSVI